MNNKKIRKKNKKILIIANCTWYLFNFRKELLEDLNNLDYDLVLACPFDSYHYLISRYFVKKENLILIRGSENLFFEIISILHLGYLMIKHRPDLVHNFTIKPCLYGGIVGRLLNIKYLINHVTGLGPIFFSRRKKIIFLNKIIYPFYKFAFNNKRATNIFHNSSDRDFFIERALTSYKKTTLIKGSGVDIEYFNNKKNTFRKREIKKLLFPARILKEKGIIELIKACEFLWRNGYSFVLNIAGDIDLENQSSLTKAQLKSILLNRNIKFLGKSNDMLKIYQGIDIVVLPSWREGLSKALLESSSMGLPIITTNVPGCADLIIDDFSGILVPVRDEYNLANAIKKLLDNSVLAERYGFNARVIVEKEYSVKKINKKILKIYNTCLDN